MDNNAVKVVIVDDCERDVRRLKDILESSDVDVEVRTFRDAEGVVEAVKTFEPDVVILDIELENDLLGGLGIAAELSHLKSYRSGKMHIIHVTGVVGYQTGYGELAALASGSHDFMAKPVPGNLILAKIMVKVNRNAELSTLLYSDDRVIIESASSSIASDHVTWRPTVRQFDIIALLIKNQGTVVSHHDIIKLFERGAEKSAVAREINYIRGYLPEDRKMIYIQTVTNKGYMFVPFQDAGNE